MKILFVLLSITIICFMFCNDKKESINSIKECNIDIDTLDFSFGIDYDDPNKYLLSGEQSDISEPYMEEIQSEMGVHALSISGILIVCHWVNQNFAFENAGGSMIGVNTVNELFDIRKFYGCHSASLIISSILREFGFPAVMIETASVQWAYNFKEGNVQSYSGHVLSEIYVDDKWIVRQ